VGGFFLAYTETVAVYWRPCSAANESVQAEWIAMCRIGEKSKTPFAADAQVPFNTGVTGMVFIKKVPDPVVSFSNGK
jgi:hypothetical protein